MTTEITTRPERVTTLELFFDLVFVFTVTQLTAVLAGDLTLRGVVQILLMLTVIMWMYFGYAWLTNAVAPNSRLRRTLILVGMGGFLAIALSIPTAFGPAGWMFGLAYLVVTVVHSALFIVFGGPGAARAMMRLGPYNWVGAALILVGGVLPPDWRYGLWALAVVVQVTSPYLNPISEFNIAPAHFVERHGLVIIVALGESIVAIGVGAAGLPVDFRLVLVAVFGLSLTYLLWWVYFGGDNEDAEGALAAVEPRRRARVALHAYGWAHLGLLLGIIAVAAGIKKAVSHPVGHLTLAEALVLASGIAVYLAADVVFRRILGIGVSRYRAAGAVLAFATVPLGLVVASAQLGALIVMLMGMLYVEARATDTMPA